MNDQQRAAMTMALKALEYINDEMCDYEGNDFNLKPEITALREALAQPQDNLNCKSVQARLATLCGYVKEQPQCNPHPDAPHGFDRNASHSADRYVCECESWSQPQGEPDWYLITQRYTTQYEQAIAAAIEATKEKAAKVCKELLTPKSTVLEWDIVDNCAAAIRSMK
jgi:hypothetical protein